MMGVSVFVVTLVVIVAVVTFIIVVTLKPSQELPQKIQLSKLKTVEVTGILAKCYCYRQTDPQSELLSCFHS